MPKDLFLAPDRHQVRCLPRRLLPTPVSVARDLCPRQSLRGVRLLALAAALVHTRRPLSRSLPETSGIIDSNSMKTRSIALAVPSVYKSNGFFKLPMPSPLLRMIGGQYTIQMHITLRVPLPLLRHTTRMLTIPRVLLPLPLPQDLRWLPHPEELRVPVLVRGTGKEDRSIRRERKCPLCISMEDYTSSLGRVRKWDSGIRQLSPQVRHHLPIPNKMGPSWSFFGFRCCFPIAPFVHRILTLSSSSCLDLSFICYLIISYWCVHGHSWPS